jgi:hypothetical protein
MFTKILCGPCGGEYRHNPTSLDTPFECVDCGHAIAGRDIVLDEGETLRVGTPLGYVSQGRGRAYVEES